MAWKMAPLIDPMAGGSVVALPDTLEKALKGIPNVDTVIEGHGDVNTWAGFRDYVAFSRALLEAAKAGLGKQSAEEVAASPADSVFTGRAAARHGIRRHAAVAGGDQRERRLPGVEGRAGDDKLRPPSSGPGRRGARSLISLS
jgi:hypothetical protein